jgi:hypothetical protein
MRVAVLNQCEYPQRWEVLRERIRSALTAAGHEVYVFCPRLGSSAGRDATDWIVPMLRPGRRAGVLWKIRSAPLPFNPFWVLWLTQQLRAYRVDVLIGGECRPSGSGRGEPRTDQGDPQCTRLPRPVAAHPARAADP